MKRRHFKPRNLLFLGLFVLCLPILIAAGLSAVGAVLAALLLSIPLYFFCFVLRLPAWQISKHRKETEDVKSAREEGRNAAQKISEEGIVLLKNEDGLLPIETKKAGKVKKPVRINLFGRCCIQTFYNGSGSAASDISRCTSVTEALESDGRFEVNRDLLHLYLNYIQKGKPSIEKSGQSAAKVKINRGGAEFLGKRPELMLREMPSEYLTTDTLYGDGKNILEHAREFSEYAVVVLGRGGAEGFELRPGELQLNEGERKLLTEVSRYFDKVILILNTANPLELGCLDEYPSVKSVLWMGLPGTAGTCALARILSGEVNPSGRLADTWTKDHMAAPACNNFQILKDSGDWNEKSWHLDNYKENQGYVIHYEEGVYVGYRYFETRYRTDPDYRYEDEVLFPFGYGLSYTSFRQQITGFCQEGDELILKVRVENTGDRPGREVIQIYVDPPYTGKIEKAFSLTAFAKTDILAPGEGEEHTFRIPAEDLASFDDREEKAYVLEKGIYEICLMKNAHEQIESVKWNAKEDIVYREDRDGKRKTDRVEAEARFDSARPYGKILTRRWEKDSNAFTGPDSSFLHASPETLEELERPVKGDGELVYTDADTPASGVKYPAKILWDDMKDVRFDDPKWDAFVSQLTVGELCSLCGNGAWHTEGIRRLGIPKRLIPDGSTGICSTLFSGIVMSNAGEGTGYPSPVIAASTWDEAVAEQLGEAAGKEARSLGYHGWYAPAMNCHRTPFNARNFEYYSEDGLLSGKIAAATVRGAGKEGIVCFLKHFALNERESAGRNQLLTYCTEQAMREIYLKPFEIAVKEGGAAGIMTSFNYIGSAWAGADRALLTDVLRGEWGFHGVVSTDACVYPHMDVKKMLEAGGDLSLDSLGGFVGGNIKRLELLKAASDRRTKVVMAKNLHRAGKNILYAFRNAEEEEKR